MALSAGSIAFTGFNGDGNDNLSFVALTNIAAGTVINFTDSNWGGSSFSNTESVFTWTAATAVAAGTVIDIDNIKAGNSSTTASTGTIAWTNTTNPGLSNDSEVVYAYVGTPGPTTFLAAISNVGYGTSEGTLTGTGLVAGTTAVSFTGGLDIVAYNGARSGQSDFSNYLSAINNPANWITQDGSGDQSADGTLPNAPFPTTVFTVAAPVVQTISFSPSSVSVAEGNSGTQTLTFTVTRSGGTTGAVSFSGTFGAGTTNAADFGGTLPGSTFSGTIAAGATSATVTITISGDTTAEADESFNLTLTSVSNPSATVAIGTAGATGTITNDDGTIISSNSSTAITLVNNDHVTIASGVTLSGSTPVTWNGGSTSPGALLDNFGTISATTRGIDTTKNAVSGSFTLHNEAGAVISSSDDAIKIRNLVSGTTGTVTITNDGTISSAVGQALDLDAIASSGASSVINNSATGLIQSGDADAIRGGTNATINNYGQIISHNASSASTGNDAIDFQAVNTGGVINNYAGGSITGARHAITGDQPITVTNAGTITGQAGSGINMDSAANTTTTVTNSGTITGTSVGGADADGIDVDGLVAIDNSGTIKAVGLVTGGSLNEALAIGGGTVTNHVGGLIVSDQRAITVDDSNNGSAFAAITITNEGTIQGGNGEAISITGTFADTITNKGTITGSIAMGGGDDVFNDYVGSSVTGPIDGGAGNDTINLLGTGEGTLGATTNVEVVKLTSGTWTVTADSSAEIDFQSGSQTLRIGAAAVADGHLDQTIKGFGSGDVIDVKNIGLATTATLGPNNVLTITGGTATVTLQLDPSQSFAGMQFAVASDGSGGTQVTVGSDTTAPTLVSATPADNATAVDPAASIVLTFSETVKAGTGSITLTNGAGDVRTISIADTTQVTISGNTVTINPTADLWGGRAYDVVVPAGAITDTAGNAYAGIALDGLDFATGPVIIPGVTAATAYAIATPGSYLLEEGATRSFTAASTANVVATVTAAGSSTTIEIDGHLVSATQGARGMQVSLVNGTVNIGDHGLIQATDNDALQYKGGVVSVNNLGEIVTLNSDGSINPDMVQGIGNGATGVAVNFKNAHGATGAVDHSSGGIINNGSADNDSALIRSDIGDAVELGTNMTLNNYGTISGNGFINDKATNNAFKNPPTDSSNHYSFTSRGVEFQDGSHDTVNNWGTITGAQHGVDASSSGSKDLAVNNYGTIVGKNGSGIGSDTSAAAADNFVVTNYGTIIGEYAGPGNVIDTSGQYSVDGDGDGVDIDGGATVINYGNIIGAGASGYDNSGRLNHSEGLSLGGGIVDNHGLIDGADYGITVNNDSNTGNSRSGSTATTITNEADGTITGDTGYAIRLENKTGTAADNDSIVNYGTIVGNGDIPDANGVTLRQDGTPDGGSVGTLDGVAYNGSGSTRFISGDGSAIQMGEGDDTLSNYGLIFGSNGRAINMEGGNDTLNVNAGSTIVGLINGGAGTDTINLIGIDGGALGTTVNVENLNVVSGSWTVADSDNYANITIKGGATVTSTIEAAVGQTVHLVVEQGGAITSNTTAVVGRNLEGGSFTIDNGGSIAGIVLTPNGTSTYAVNNAAAGTITGGVGAEGDLGSGSFMLINDGTIIGSTEFGKQAVATEGLRNGTATIINHAGGLITTVADTDIIRAGSAMTVQNYGTIESIADDNGRTGGDGVDFRKNSGGVVHNYDGGLIEASHHAVTGKLGGTIINDAGGTMIGRNGSAVNFDNNAAVANTVYVTNHGTMLGESAGYDDSDGDAIDVDGLVQLDNYGQVEGLGANGTHDGGANVSEGVAIGGGVVNNYAGATIYGYGRAIQVDDSANGAALAATTIYNEGTIQGDGNGPQNFEEGSDVGIVIAGREAIDILGTFADTITNKGTIIGGVFTDGGDDTFNAYVGSSVSKTVDLGDGSDTVNLYAADGNTAMGVIGQMANVETLNVKSGNWKLGFGFAGANIDVSNGAAIVSGTATAAMSLSGGQTLTVEQGGLVQGTKTAIFISGGDVDANIVNSGTINVTSRAGTDKADAISLNGATATIHNTSTGVITGGRHAITGPIGIHVINDAGGLIVGQNGSAVNMDNSETEDHAAFVTNYGTMLGDSANISDSDGDAIDVDGLLHLDNYGVIRGEGANGYHKGEANVSEGLAIGGGTVHNHAGAMIYGYGRAIQVDNSSNAAAFASATIINDGTIQGGGNGPTGVAAADAAAMQARINGAEAIDILGTFADTITNTATGKIIGGIFTDGGNDVLSNAGTITAMAGSAVNLGDGDDTLTNTGTITGAVLLGAGNDTFNAYVGSIVSGTIDGGDDNDTVNLEGTGSGTLGSLANVETINVVSGAWKLTNTAGISTIHVENGATLSSSVFLTGHQNIVVDAGGIMHAAADYATIKPTGILANASIDNSGTIYGIVYDNSGALPTGQLSLINEAGGFITAGDGAGTAISFGALAVTFDNYGTVTGSTSSNVIAVEFQGAAAGSVLVNHAGGLIQTSANQDIVHGWNGVTIDNAGTIRSLADVVEANPDDPSDPFITTGGDAIDFKKSAGTVHNEAGGLIEGSHHAVTGKFGITVINDAGGTMIGRNGSAVNMDNDASPANTAYVINHGTMLGESAGYSDSDGDAIDVDGLIQLDNYGLVQGLGANGTHDGGANVSEGVAIGGGVVNNYAGATIYGYGRAIQVDDSANGAALAATTIYNEGTIQGDGHGPQNFEDGSDAGIVIAGREAIDILGSFADTITNKGTIIGGVFTDGGDDTFNAYTGSSVSGPIDGGDGNDTFHLLGAGGGSLGTVVNFEKLDVDAGTWEVADTTSFQTIEVGSGATLAGEVRLTGSQHLVIDAGGKVDATTDGVSARVFGVLDNAVIDNSGTLYGVLTEGRLSGSVTLINREGGLITGGDTSPGSLIAFGRTTVTVDNAGTIRGSETSSTIALDFEVSTAKLVNRAGGLITTVAYADVIRGGAGTTIDNSGTIRSGDDERIVNPDDPTDVTIVFGGDAIAFKNKAGGIIHNYGGGLIEGSHHALSGKLGMTVINDAGGTMIGRNGSAVNVDNDASVANTVYVTNHGEMDGKSAGYADSDGDAIDADGLLKVDNYGQIKGLGANGTHNGGANVSEGIAAGGGVINNYAGATIYGYGRAIQVDDSANGSALAATTVYNEGTIQGDGHGPQNFEPGSDAGIVIAGREAIDILGSFADTITNKGTIIGGVFTDGGDDTFNAYAGSTSGKIDLGDGNDTIHLLGNGNGSLGAIANVENLDVDAGTWTLASVAGVSNIDIASGATVTSALTLTGNQHLTIEQGGALAIGTSATAITWVGTGSSTVIDNYGLIQSAAGSGISIGSPLSGTLTVNNHVSGQILDLLNFNGISTGTSIVINNDGLIQGDGNFAIRIARSGGASGVITNSSTGVITSTAASADVISWASNTLINNSGKIVSAADTATSSGGSAIEFSSGLGNTIHNLAGGLIEGSHHAVSGKAGVTVINDAGGVMVGRNGSAVNVDNNGSVANTVYVTNYGEMDGKSAGYADSDGDAIDADGLLKVDNYGQIKGLGANGTHNVGANVSEGIAAGGGVINNYAGATIYGYGRAIQVDDSANGSALAATTIYNEGTIQGDGHGPQNFEPGSDAGIVIDGREAIDILGSFADTITNKGTIIGGVFTDGGDDVFNAYTGSASGKIDLGAGNDTVNLLGTGNGTLGVVRNAEKLVVQSGTWNVGDASSFTDIDVRNGATIRNLTSSTSDRLAMTGSQNLTVEQGGSVQAYSIGFDVAGNPIPVPGTALSLRGSLNVVIDNSGTIEGLSEDTIIVGSQFVSPSGAVTITNRETGVISRGMVLNGATNTIDNYGQITGAYDNNIIAINTSGAASNTIINNHTGGLITTRADQNVIQAGNGTTIDNAGTIRSQDDYTDEDGDLIAGKDAIAFKSATGSVHNEAGGVIEGSHHAVSGKVGLTVINDQGGVMVGRNGSAVNVDNNASVANTVHVTNHGTMLGESAGYEDSDGDAIDTDGLLQLDNYGDVKGLGANGTHNGGANVSEGVAIGGGVINNYAGATIYGYGRAIQVDNSANGSALAATTIYNEGTIQGDGHGPQNFEEGSDVGIVIVGREAIDILGSFADTITNKGAIIGGVAMGGGDDTLTNTGSITATGGSAIDMGDGDDTVILGNGSVVTGAILLGAGDDTLSATGSVTAIAVDAGTGNDVVVGGSRNDVVHGGDGDDTLVGGAGNDTLYGDAGNNSLAGGDDNDIIFGGASNDHIEGDRGNDTLIGGNGSDVYVYASGDGSDSIVESFGLAGDTDQLVFTDIDATGMTLYKHGNDLDIVLRDGSEILVKHQFGGGGVENILFGDGTVFDKAAIAADLTDRGPVVSGDVVLPAVTEDAPSFTISFADLLANASDADLDVLTVSAVGHFTGGTATVGANGVIITLDPNYNGPIAFDYTVDDGRGGTAQAHASFDVTPVNDAPVVVTPVAVTTNEDTPVTGQIVATDVDGDTLSYSIKGDGAGHGTVTIDDHGNWSYTPAANYNGGDSFVVSVSDGHTVVDSTVSLTVAPVNDAPVVVAPVAVTTNEDTPATGHILATDVDGDALSYSIKGDGAAHGIVTIDDHGNWSYTPSANYNGGDSFVVSVSDGHTVVDSTVSLTINPVNDAPHAVNDVATVGENDSALFNLTGNDTDVEDGSPSLTGFHVTGVDGVSLTNDQVSSAFSIVNGQLQYNPGSLFDSLNDGQHATVSISYTAEDTGHASTTGQFTLTVNGVTDANVINGTDGADTLTGTSGVDQINAGDGNDNIYSGAGDDIIDAGKGDDYVFAAAGNKTVDGGDGNDYLFGGAGNSLLNGGNGNDHITGGAGNETINGGAGNDTLMGGAGNDIITGGQGNDLLYGGAGSDTFVFKAGDGHDTVFDFQATGASHDVVQLDSHVFADFNALMQSGAVHDVAGGVHIDYADGSSMALAGVMKASLTVDDFRFA